MLLFELGNSDFKTYVSKTPNQHTYTFVTPDDQEIVLTFHMIQHFAGPPLFLKVEDKSGVGIDFSNETHDGDTQGITGTGEQFKILGAVHKIISNFITEHKPELIMFGAHEPSRQKLYDRWSNLIIKKFDYELDDLKNHSDYAAILGDSKYYVLKKK